MVNTMQEGPQQASERPGDGCHTVLLPRHGGALGLHPRVALATDEPSDACHSVTLTHLTGVTGHGETLTASSLV